ncbi:family 43 glycosylhydrolase [Hymenobacter caeli]|uniref:GH43 family beta-xylosidase n=1 Tax=Hymenobacter caeli TaxID=2735894 RepID=A0ABX2FSK5_9BACT|nr:glycoside hydrolase family 43 protein [Hymenobacter caeli]NRT19449.1 GH43 family beta-xylosidase [Hymenobacter caeli]
MTLPNLLLGTVLAAALLGCRGTAVPGAGRPPARTFTNPLLKTGPDPWVYQKDGVYYYLNTTGVNVTLWKTARMSELGAAVGQVVWTPPAAGPNAHDVWAPELHFLDGKWYIYFTAGPGPCCGGQRLWVLENAGPDPTAGTWTEKGRLAVPGQDLWDIDATVFEQRGRRYLLWSGQEAGSDQQNLYICRLQNPWTLTGARVRLSHPEYAWERRGFPKVNEGPEVLQHAGRTFVVYSTSHCSTDDYALGMLTASAAADPMDARAWQKSATPVFTQSPASHAYGPGHNAFFVSKNGRENWLIYHANSHPGEGCGNARNPRMQPFTWNADGSPNFGTPVATGVPLARPGGE